MLTVVTEIFYFDCSASNYWPNFSSGMCQSWNFNGMRCFSMLLIKSMNLRRRNGTLDELLAWKVLHCTFLVDDHLSWLSRFLFLVLADSQLNNWGVGWYQSFSFKISFVIIFIIICLCNQTTGRCCLYTDFLWNAMNLSKSWVNLYFLNLYCAFLHCSSSHYNSISCVG